MVDVVFLLGSKDLCLPGKIVDPQESLVYVLCCYIPIQAIVQLGVRHIQRNSHQLDRSIVVLSHCHPAQWLVPPSLERPKFHRRRRKTPAHLGFSFRRGPGAIARSTPLFCSDLAFCFGHAQARTCVAGLQEQFEVAIPSGQLGPHAQTISGPIHPLKSWRWHGRRCKSRLCFCIWSVVCAALCFSLA